MSTFLSLHYHLVFSTKDRRPLMDSRWRSKLHDYLGATVKGLHGYPQGIGGTSDHVHLLIGLNATHCLADFMRELKKAATKWVQHEIRLPDFAWQEGYGAFTVSATSRSAVRKYISHQEDHHRIKTFREELEGFLIKAGVVYEDRYLD